MAVVPEVTLSELILSELIQQLPQSKQLVRVVHMHKMDRLCVLRLWCVSAATLDDPLQALATAPTCTLETLDLLGSQFSPPAMQALHCALLRHSKSMTELMLRACGITDEQACILATALNGLTELREVDLSFNVVGDEGAVAIATSLNRLPQLRKVDLLINNVTRRGCKALENWGKNNTQVELDTSAKMAVVPELILSELILSESIQQLPQSKQLVRVVHITYM